MAFLYYFTFTLVTLVTLLYYYFTRTFNYWKHKGVAGPQPVPLFGNIIDSALRKKTMGVVFKELYESCPKEKVVGIYRMTTPCLLIRDLDIIKNVMIKDFDMFSDRGIEFSKEGLGANLFHVDGDTWRVLRNCFTPIFTSGKLKNMLYLLNERGDSFVQYIDSLCSKQSEHEVHQLVQRYTMATISACAFGLDVDTQYNSKILETIRKMDTIMFKAKFATEIDMLLPGIFQKFNCSFFPAYVTEFFDNLAKNIISQRNGVPSSRKDFMDLILELRQKGEVEGTKRNADQKVLKVELTDEIIAAQAFIFYAAGYETSATTMAFMLYLLAKNPDIQDKLIADIDAVLQKYNGEVTYEALQDMSYMERVFDETLRVYPLVEPTHRVAKADYKIPGTDVTIDKGTMVFVSAYGIHNDEKYFPNPEKFDPDRHTIENSKDRHPSAYIPFGIGPRNCIGMRFAKVQSRVCITKFFSKFRVEFSKNTPRDIQMCPYKFLICPKGGIHLNITRRN